MKKQYNQSFGIFTPAERFRIVWFLGWAAIIINAVMVVVQAILGRLNYRNTTLFTLFIIVLLVTMFLVKRRFRYSIALFFITLEVLVPIILYGIGTSQSPAVAIYMMVIFIVGLLNGRRGIVLATIVSILSLLSVVYMLNGADAFSGSIAAAMVSQILTFTFTALLTFVVVNSIEGNQLELYKFKDLVHQSPLAMMIFDLTGKVQYVNKAFTELTDFTPEEVKQITAQDYMSSVLTKSQYDHFWKTIRSGQVWEEEVISTTKLGKAYHEKLIVRPIVDQKGRTIHYTAIAENISTRKKAEIALRYAHDDMQEKLDEIIRLKNSLQEQIIHDSLTGLYNRRFFSEVIERELIRTEREKSALSLIILDIDHFKTVNDTFGHMTGDEVLRELANFLTKNVRKMDIVCRYGGEEFVIIMPGASANTASKRAEVLREGIYNNNILSGDHEIQITCSFGICAYPEFAGSVDQLLSRADIAMYVAKQSGRNRCVIWSPEMSVNSELVNN